MFWMSDIFSYASSPVYLEKENQSVFPNETRYRENIPAIDVRGLRYPVWCILGFRNLGVVIICIIFICESSGMELITSIDGVANEE